MFIDNETTVTYDFILHYYFPYSGNKGNWVKSILNLTVYAIPLTLCPHLLTEHIKVLKVYC